jgi:predicted TIM-barrel fold metal-dependent hydrolase
MEYCAAHNIPVLCHTWEEEPMNRPGSFKRYLAKYPDMKIILGHMGGVRQGCMEAMQMARDYKNVYCDINGSLYSELWIEELVKFAPPEKFIFSTDQTFNDTRPVLGRVLLSHLPDRVKEMILCENAETLVGKKLV